jgi:hypothetical protein
MARPSNNEMTKRLARCIGIWETNRGGDDPAPKESALDTVAGVHASMATIEQATMPYAIDAFARFTALRSQASPAITAAEITAGRACCKAVELLTITVQRAAAAATDPKTFIASNGTMIATSFLSDADVRTMFAAAALKGMLDRLRADVAARRTTLDNAATNIPARNRLGLGIGSLKAYVRKASIWGENRAGWQRKAVRAMPGDLGSRLELVATSGGGVSLALPVIGDHIKATLAIRPNLSAQELISIVAQQNNPREANYGRNVLTIYNRLYPTV